MPRENRIQFENSFHHIIARGYSKMQIFFSDNDFRFFIKQIEAIHQSHGIIIHSYCLMSNHVHLLLQNPMTNLSQAMQLLFTRYADYFKRKYNHSGKVFERRYKSILVDTESYLIQLSKYIHRNPVGVMVNDPIHWSWSSYKYFVNPKIPVPSFLEKELILIKFGKKNSIQNFIKFTEENDEWDPNDYIFSRTILGSEKFLEEVTLKHISPIIDTGVRASYTLNKTYRSKLEIIKQFISKSNYDLTTQICLMIFALRQKTNLTYKEISDMIFLGSFSPSAISGNYSRIKAKAKNDLQLSKTLIDIKCLQFNE
ncbi:MAG: transposase [Candidatus Caenarcaniphilales bacterium]|jgi:REP element-mobilizing transposase RayT|nr:transposase [Candidatus Caenarcaniphilales bacterium]